MLLDTTKLLSLTDYAFEVCCRCQPKPYIRNDEAAIDLYVGSDPTSLQNRPLGPKCIGENKHSIQCLDKTLIRPMN